MQRADLTEQLHAATRLVGRTPPALPRWYRRGSTTLFLTGAALLCLGVPVGWFVPAAGVAVLVVNVAVFAAVTASWRARGVIPRRGVQARRRFWHLAPPLTILALTGGFFALASDGAHNRLWVSIAVLIPFGIEHAVRMRTGVRA